MAAKLAGAERVTEIIALLQPEPPRKWPESLTAAATAGDVERMLLFLDRGSRLEERSAGFASPLVAACAAGQADAVRLLISRGAVLDPPGAPISPAQDCRGQPRLKAPGGLKLVDCARGPFAAEVRGLLEQPVAAKRGRKGSAATPKSPAS